jgi:hypothetical protein
MSEPAKHRQGPTQSLWRRRLSGPFAMHPGMALAISVAGSKLRPKSPLGRAAALASSTLCCRSYDAGRRRDRWHSQQGRELLRRTQYRLVEIERAARGRNTGLGRGGIALHQRRVLKRLSVRVKAASDPGWPIVFDPGLGSLYASKPIKLLLRAFRPYHNDETPAALRWKNFEGRLIFDCRHFTTSPIIRRTEGRSAYPYSNRRPNIFSASRNEV